MHLHTRIDTFLDTGTDKLYPLLTEAEEPEGERFKFTTDAPDLAAYDGGRKWIYLKNASGGALAAGEIVAMKALAAGVERGHVEKAAADAGRHLPVAVVQVAVADGEYFWGVREGDCEVLAGTETIDVGVELCASSVSGRGQEASAAGDALRQFGIGRENGASGSTARCYVRCVG